MPGSGSTSARPLLRGVPVWANGLARAMSSVTTIAFSRSAASGRVKSDSRKVSDGTLASLVMRASIGTK